MTPKKPRKGWWVPPIARASSSVITMDRGVAQIMKPIVRMSSIGGTNFRYRSEPGMRSMPSHR